jgi:hypothetical protein
MDVPPPIRGPADRFASDLASCSSIAAASTISTAGCCAPAGSPVPTPEVAEVALPATTGLIDTYG